jgi:hypothetical protein
MEALLPDLVREWAVVLVQTGDGDFRAYTTEVERLPELSRRPSLMTVNTRSAPAPPPR